MGLFFGSFGACLLYGIVFAAFNQGLMIDGSPKWGAATFVIPGAAALVLSGLIGGMAKGCS